MNAEQMTEEQEDACVATARNNSRDVEWYAIVRTRSEVQLDKGGKMLTVNGRDQWATESELDAVIADFQASNSGLTITKATADL